jgi:hypothetical protein
MKLVRLIKMYLQVGKHLSDMFPIKNGWKYGNALSPLVFDFASDYSIKMVQVNHRMA